MFPARQGALEEFGVRFPGLVGPALRALSLFAGVVITNNRSENLWKQPGGRGLSLLVAILARLALGARGLAETLTTAALPSLH